MIFKKILKNTLNCFFHSGRNLWLVTHNDKKIK